MTAVGVAVLELVSSILKALASTLWTGAWGAEQLADWLEAA